MLVQVLPKLKGLRGELDQALTVVDVLLDQMLQSLTGTLQYLALHVFVSFHIF